MSSPAHQSPENRSATPENTIIVEPPLSGFTAVNGRSPSNASSAGTASEHGRTPAASRHKESHASPGKRKESVEPSSPSNEQHASKKVKTSEAQEHSESVQMASEAAGHETSRENADGNHERNSSDSSWPIHERNGSITSDAQLAEVLQSNITAQQMTPVDAAQDQRYSVESAQSQQYQGPSGHLQTPPGMTSSQMQKQRKRNFSNRTKTGCLTCRERKKKCDEGKPECSNCQRGGFYCKGYSQPTNTHFKAAIHRDQPPLQAKNGYYNGGYRYALPAPPYYEPPNPDGRRPGPGDDGREQGRPILQPQEPNLRPGYGSQQPWPEQSPSQPYGREPLARPEYQQVAPLRELPHQQKQMVHPPPAPIHPPHNRSMSQHGPQNGQPAQFSRGPAAPYADQRLMAQSALDHPSSQMTYADEHLSEKQKMLKSLPFNRRDAKLKQERYDCAQSTYRYNKNAIEPGNLSEPSRREQFRQILEGSKSDGSPNTRKRRSISPQNERVIGHMGLRVEVEAPFYCEYGYNINLGDDVEIGPNCRIMDSCHVEIGARCIIGPDVKLLTVDCDHGPRLPGQKRACRAKRIVVGDDVFIGAGAIILPGISIHKGATIGAGAVISKDVPGPLSVVTSAYQRYPKTHYPHIPNIPNH